MKAEKSRRSREGAWIEMASRKLRNLTDERRSREGAWIEIKEQKRYKVNILESLP